MCVFDAHPPEDSCSLTRVCVLMTSSTEKCFIRLLNLDETGQEDRSRFHDSASKFVLLENSTYKNEISSF